MVRFGGKPSKRGAFVTACFILGLVFFYVIALGTLGSSEETSKEENRALAAWPEFSAEAYFSGSVYKGIDGFMADHVPARAFLIRQADKVKNFMELAQEEKLVRVRADIGASPTADTPDATFETQELRILPDRMLEIYKKDIDAAEDYASTVNRIAANVPEGVNVYSMLVPMRIEFEDSAYKSAATAQKDAIESIYASLDEKVVTADAYSKMAEHQDEYVYYRTDHHWTALGAYYGMQAFSEAADFRPLKITEYKETVLEGFLGYLYHLSPNESVRQHPDALCYYTRKGRNNPTTVYYYGEDGTLLSRDGLVFETYYDGSGEADVSYALFLGGDCPMVEIQGDGPRGRVLAIIKDSYGNAFMPWLTPYFSKIIGIDPRHFNEDLYETLLSKKVTDLLVLDYTKVTMTHVYPDLLKKLATG